MPRPLVITLAWLQLLVSVVIAAGTVYTYTSFDTAIREGSRSAATALAGMADATQHASETIEARRLLISQATSVLDIAARQIDQLQGLAAEQAELVPQYAEGLRATSQLLSTMANTSQAIASALNFQVPTGVTRDGLKLHLVMSKPLEDSSKRLSETASQMKSVGTTLSTLSSSIEKGANTLSHAVDQTSRELRIQLSNLKSSLELASSKEVPAALADLKKTSDSLRSLSNTIAGEEDLGRWLMAAGLLLSVWCFFNSLTSIGLALTQRARQTSPIKH